jgi:hypothetical protein
MNMGNRAVVSVEGSKVGVYLHWNGSMESVKAFLRAAKDLGVRDPSSDTSYFYARFVQIIGNFFGGTTSVGIDSIDHLDTDNGDNGVFIIDQNFHIVTRKYFKGDDTAYDKEYEDRVYKDVMQKNQPIFERKEY